MRVADASGASWAAVVATTLVLAGCAGCSEGRPGPSDGSPGTSADVSVGEAAPGQPDAGLLPAPLKGYELYAWEEAGLLWFTLVTGTNRIKTLDEITQKNVDERNDFVRINSSGWDNLQRILALVPRGTPVVLDSRFAGLPPLSEASRNRIQQMLSALRN